MAQILDITQGLGYLHEAKPSIVRRDLKSVGITALISNSRAYITTKYMVNITTTDERSACLADFGLASVEDSQTVTLSSESGGRTTGTPRWQAPELLDSQLVDLAGWGKNSLASDVYSCACVCYEACLVQYRRSCHTI